MGEPHDTSAKDKAITEATTTPSMDTPEREAQALREVGRTEIRKVSAVLLSLVFLLTIGWVAPFDALRRDDGGPFAGFLLGLSEVLGSAGELGFLNTNRGLKQQNDQLETALEETSWLRERFVPRVQWRLATTLGMGNEQAVVGRDGWLFYRPDVDHVIGRGFLEPAVLQARGTGGDLWSTAPQPDPVAALVRFADEMRSRGIHTVVVPTPVKPTVDPQALVASGRVFRGPRDSPTAPSAPVQNASLDDFVSALQAAGVEVFDPAPLLVEARLATGASQYLRTDTHWTPQAVDRVAEALARRIETLFGVSTEPSPYRRQRAVMEGFGDVAAMLHLPTTQDRIPPERVEAQMVLSRHGTTWRSDPAAEILLLGDSFSNVFSDAGLGWGTGAGLAEQLSYELGLPVDKIARNAGGARATREALWRALAEDEDRLANKRLVLYQFATRELSQGDWQLDDLAP